MPEGEDRNLGGDEPQPGHRQCELRGAEVRVWGRKPQQNVVQSAEVTQYEAEPNQLFKGLHRSLKRLIQKLQMQLVLSESYT